MLTPPAQPYKVDALYYMVTPGPWGLMGLAASNKGLIHIQSAVTSEKVYLDFLKWPGQCSTGLLKIAMK